MHVQNHLQLCCWNNLRNDVWLTFSGIRFWGCWRFSNVLANVVVDIFRVNVFGVFGNTSDSGRCVWEVEPDWTSQRVECYPIEGDHADGGKEVIERFYFWDLVVMKRCDEKCPKLPKTLRLKIETVTFAETVENLEHSRRCIFKNWSYILEFSRET
jgi:hypothetical protein